MSEKEQLSKSDFLEIEGGDCFVALKDEGQCVNECVDVGNVLQDVIASLYADNNSEVTMMIFAANE